MDIDPRIVVGAAIVLTVILWAAAIVLQRVDARVTARGFRNGSLIAVVLFLIATIVVTIYFNGRTSGLITLDLPGALAIGVFVGLLVGLGYLWLGGILMAFGLIFKSKPAWSTAGVWAAVPVIVVSLGFGYVSFRSVQQEGSDPSTYLGGVDLELSGAQLGDVHASGKSQCQYDETGAVRVRAGGGVGGVALNSDGGVPIYIQFGLDATATQPTIQIMVGRIEADPGNGWQPSLETIAVAPGSTPQHGEAVLSGILPLVNARPDPTERWSGHFTWSCAYTDGPPYR
jgi:hypothetical protein